MNDSNKKKYIQAYNNLKLISSELDELSVLYDECLVEMKKSVKLDEKTIEEDVFIDITKVNNDISNEIKNEVLTSLTEKI